MTFLDRLEAARRDVGSVLCVGLDPEPEKLPAPLRHLPPAEGILEFGMAIIGATAPFAAAFKPNLAFYEALGPEGWRVFFETVRAVPAGRLVIADAKRGDIGNTARRYAAAFYDAAGCDAVTVAPWMGRDAITPFLEHEGRCAFVLAATSNAGSADLQALSVEGEPLWMHAARLAVACGEDAAGTAGLVVGATRPEVLAEARAAFPTTPFLVPGVGAQGGQPDEVLAAAGSGPLLVNSSRAILYARSDADFARAAADVAEQLAGALQPA